MCPSGHLADPGSFRLSGFFVPWMRMRMPAAGFPAPGPTGSSRSLRTPRESLRYRLPNGPNRNATRARSAGLAPMSAANGPGVPGRSLDPDPGGRGRAPNPPIALCATAAGVHQARYVSVPSERTHPGCPRSRLSTSCGFLPFGQGEGIGMRCPHSARRKPRCYRLARSRSRRGSSPARATKRAAAEDPQAGH